MATSYTWSRVAAFWMRRRFAIRGDDIRRSSERAYTQRQRQGYVIDAEERGNRTEEAVAVGHRIPPPGQERDQRAYRQQRHHDGTVRDAEPLEAVKRQERDQAEHDRKRGHGQRERELPKDAPEVARARRQRPRERGEDPTEAEVPVVARHRHAEPADGEVRVVVRPAPPAGNRTHHIEREIQRNDGEPDHERLGRPPEADSPDGGQASVEQHWIDRSHVERKLSAIEHDRELPVREVAKK